MFISHKSEDEQCATEIKKRLLYGHGIVSFVAHRDIKPTTEWRRETLRALREMDGLIALLTPKFRDSEWTDQEVGFALGRDVPVISVHLGVKPHGFIEEKQAFRGNGKAPSQLADEVAESFFKNNSLGEMRINAYLWRLRRAGSFDAARALFPLLRQFASLSPEQERRLVDIFNTNSQVGGCFTFIDGIVYQLRRATGNDYKVTGQGFHKQLIPLALSAPRPAPNMVDDDDLPWGDDEDLPWENKDNEDDLPW